MDGRMNILFVCTGNTCRSPMAEHLLKKKLTEEAMDHMIQVRSAGVSAVLGGNAATHAVEVLKRRQYPQLELHRSAPVNRAMVEQADLILTMTMTHKNILIAQYPEYSGKVFTLLEYIDQQESNILHNMLSNVSNKDIADPFGGDLEQYEACASQLEQAIDRMYEKLRHQLQ